MESKANILIVDDKVSVLNSLEFFLSQHYEHIDTLKNPNQLESLLKRKNFDLLLLDMNFSAGVSTGNEGLYWMRKIKKIDPDIVIILITAYGDVELAVNAIKEGATDFVLKPWDNKKLLATIQTALKLKFSQDRLNHLEQQHHLITKEWNDTIGFYVGNTPKMKELEHTIQKVAKTDASVLILGENGTGKEVIAREIHKQSRRSKEVLIRVDVGSIPETLFESEMFGHVKGAFTDAKESRTGRFELASGSTLFLDEIGNLSLNLQSKLLTVLENRKIIKVGGNKEIPIDIRLISATNKNLPDMVSKKLFREDLFFRMNTISLEIPPLRERSEDIIHLAELFLKRFKARYNKTGIQLHQHATNQLKSYHWPGNIRELKHTIEKAVILAEKSEITPSELGLYDMDHSAEQVFPAISLEDGEKILIRQALKKTHGNITEAARELKIGRQTLYRKMERYGL